MSHSTSTVFCAVILQFCKSGIKTSPYSNCGKCHFDISSQWTVKASVSR